jgi:hypothetical protein
MYIFQSGMGLTYLSNISNDITFPFDCEDLLKEKS